MIGRSARILNADAPGSAVLQSSDVDIAAALDHKGAKAATPEHARGTIDGITLPDAAHVYRHPFARDKNCTGGLIDLNRPVVDERQPSSHFTHVGDRVVLIVIEFPQTRQRTESDV